MALYSPRKEAVPVVAEWARGEEEVRWEVLSKWKLLVGRLRGEQADLESVVDELVVAFQWLWGCFAASGNVQWFWARPDHMQFVGLIRLRLFSGTGIFGVEVRKKRK